MYIFYVHLCNLNNQPAKLCHEYYSGNRCSLIDLLSRFLLIDYQGHLNI